MKKICAIILTISSLGFIQSQNYIQTPIPNQTGTFTPNIRGYWFVAPTCFTITGAMVPTDADPGNQSIAIMRLETTPPTYSTTTNNFDLLYLTQNNPDLDTIGGLHIIVNQGDIIGVFGCRSNFTSYSNTANTTTINGISTPITRLGMQFPLTTTAPQQLWTEAAANIGRVFLYYDTTMLYNITSTNIGADYTFADGTDTLYTNLFSVWDYGDGSPLDTNYNPTHTYATNGNYTVCSYVNTACGIDTICANVNVCLFPPTAGFSNNLIGLDVTCTDVSTNASNWFWDFGDGGTSTIQNPTHTYSTNGWYDITQIVSNSCGPNDTIIDSVLICVPANASFTSNASGFNSSFTDASTYTTSWNWDFGDGNNSTLQNPLHTYATMGWYDVTLIVSNFCGPNDTIVDSVLICTPPIAGAFTPSNLNTVTASFIDGSSNATSWNWDFGDGTTSMSQNPTHNYLSNGTYSVCLIVSNLCGADTLCNMVTVCPSDPTSSFTNTNSVFTANFTNSSTFATTSQWNFGDGNSSNNTNPSHTFTLAGTYFVCLTSYDDCGDSTVFCDSVSIAGNVGIDEIADLQSMNSYPNPTNGSANISLNSLENIDGKLFVTDITGKVVSTIFTGLFMQGHLQYNINTNPWRDGIYLLVWETSRWKISKKLIVN